MLFNAMLAEIKDGWSLGVCCFIWVRIEGCWVGGCILLLGGFELWNTEWVGIFCLMYGRWVHIYVGWV